MRGLRMGEPRNRQQAGFSMVEMLMAAFILAIGILGLTALQTLALRSGASSRGLDTAVLLAERVMDEIEANGRNSLQYARATIAQTPPNPGVVGVFMMLPAVVPANLIDPPGAPTRTYNFAGRPSLGDAIDPSPYFNLYIQPVRIPDAANPGVVVPVPRLGGIANMVVTIRWYEAAGAPARQVVLSRRVAYATAI